MMHNFESERANAIANDRREIMSAVRQHPANAASFKLPMRWFDDWTREPKREQVVDSSGFRWGTSKPADPIEDILQLDRHRQWGPTYDEYVNIKRMYQRAFPAHAKTPYEWLPNMTPAARDAHTRSFQGHWPERNDDDKSFCKAVSDFRKRNAHLYDGQIRLPSAEEQQPFVDELVTFPRAEYITKVGAANAWRREIDGEWPVRSSAETEVLRAWATYYLQTELFDRSGPHLMVDGEAIPGGPHAHAALRYAAKARETTEATCNRLVKPHMSVHLRREVIEIMRNGTKNGGDVIMALERFLEQLPAACDEP